MKHKLAGRLMSLIPDDMDLDKAEPFRHVLMRQLAEPFPYRPFQLLLSELTDKQKKFMVDFLNIKIKIPQHQPFPDATFMQLLRMRISKNNEKVKAIRSILPMILPLLKDADSSQATGHLQAESELVQQYGKWHYYWSLRFFPIEDESIQHRLAELDTEPASPHPQQAITPAASLIASTCEAPEAEEAAAASETDPEALGAEQTSVSEITASLQSEKGKALVAKERELRQKAELEAEKLRKQLRLLEKSHQRTSELYSGLEHRSREQQGRLGALEEALEQEKKKGYALERTKVQLESELRQLNKGLEQQQEREHRLQSQSQEQLDELKGKMKLLEQEVRSRSRPQLSAEQVLQFFQEKAGQYFADVAKVQDPTARVSLRERISSTMLLMNTIETWLQEDMAPADHPATEQAESAPQPDRDPEQAASPVTEETPDPSATQDDPAPEDRAPFYSGTFYRRDHGGYIVLEHGETFNITESMVNSIGLEHEAEVQCEPQQREDGTTSYYIRLLLQGDDSLAPVQQFMGYVKLGEHFTYYCVDVNNEELRFPIHEKDVAIQDPQDGDPCLFNVAVDGRYARLSKLFTAAELPQTDHAVKARPASRPKMTREEEPERYLEGCTIVIIGGLAKWFESVVAETGAKLVHDTGRSAERVHPHLRRANALFMLLSANSHDATGSCVPIAKECGVPHFKIEGSKSNLRKQLWDHQALIRSSPQLVDG
ncbi:hypothetical protein ACH6EH_19255 [Paenibacillus sp. JSM ZJ436]|uniref:hypothetical protein n=1 Tax=Paenibacillus sp. JSM ZJ436 TaxID=3376190 RepID=UPI0037A61961